MKPSFEEICRFVRHAITVNDWYFSFPLVPPGVAVHVFLGPRLRYEVFGEEVSRPGQRRRWEDYLPPVAVAGAMGEQIPVPSEILDAGAVRLTAVVDQRSARLQYWRHLTRETLQRSPWPAETGGAEVPAHILALRKIRAAESLKSAPALLRNYLVGGGSVDAALDALLEPERRRQEEAFRQAAIRVVRLAYD